MKRTVSIRNLFVVVIAFVALGCGEQTGSVAKAGSFIVSDYLSGLDVCITIAFSPDSGNSPDNTSRLFYLEKNSGRVRVVRDGKLDPKPWASLKVDPGGERGLLGIVFDPLFKENGYVYFYYSVPGSGNNRVVRLKEIQGRGVEESTVLEIEDFVRATNHNGGNINFGPDGFLYITVGDGGGSPGRSQDDTNLLGKILRVDVRGPLPVTPNKSGKPSDIFYAKGLRNSFDMAWNPANDTLYATENGPIGRDEINRITGGGNYGWPEEKGQNKSNVYTNPLWDFGLFSVAPTGITFYPEWGNFPDQYKGTMFVTDYNKGRVYNIRLTGKGLDRIRKEDFIIWQKKQFAGTGFADIIVGPDGALYLAGFTKIVKIEYRK